MSGCPVSKSNCHSSPAGHGGQTPGARCQLLATALPHESYSTACMILLVGCLQLPQHEFSLLEDWVWLSFDTRNRTREQEMSCKAILAAKKDALTQADIRAHRRPGSPSEGDHATAFEADTNGHFSARIDRTTRTRSPRGDLGGVETADGDCLC